MADHFALRIVTTAASLIETASTYRAFPQLSRTLSATEQELPAYGVALGGEQAEEADFQSFGSLLTLNVTAYSQKDTELEALTELQSLRRLAHVGIMSADRLDLPFVSRVLYGGTDEPVMTAGEHINAQQTSQWLVHYEMPLSDPS